MSGGSLLVEPYAGIGAHHWVRRTTRVSNGVLSVKENYSWFNAPLGARVTLPEGPTTQIALDASALIPFSASMKVADMDDAQVELGSEVGYRTEMPITLKLSALIDGVAAPGTNGHRSGAAR